MSNRTDLADQRFGRLTAIKRVGRTTQYGHVRWLCRCDCGDERIVASHHLRSGRQQSCGCLQRELAKRRATTHGQSDTPTFNIWLGMWSRCTNPKVRHYKHYGGRGIRVCERWLKFENFLADVGPRPSARHSIDRYPNNDGHYEPGNTRWATREEQQLNSSRVIVLTHDGRAQSLSAWCRELSLNRFVVAKGYHNGLRPPELLLRKGNQAVPQSGIEP